MTQKKAKMIYKTVGFSLTALCFVLSKVYRPYAYSLHLNDFHLADSYTSFFGVPIVVCLTQAYSRFRDGRWSIPKTIFCAIGLFMIWEFQTCVRACSASLRSCGAFLCSRGATIKNHLIESRKVGK